jgi:hypothetical protein
MYMGAAQGRQTRARTAQQVGVPTLPVASGKTHGLFPDFGEPIVKGREAS